MKSLTEEGRRYMTGIERLAWAVEFAQVDWRTLTRPGDLPNLRHDLDRFLRWQGTAALAARDVGGLLAHADTSATTLSEPALRQLQAEVRGFLDEVVGLQALRPGDSLTARPIPIEAARFHVSPGGGTVVASGAPRDVFLLVLCFLVTQSPGRLRRCPECRRIFVRVRKQQYCGRTCANRVAVRAFRSKRSQAERQTRAREAAHQRYKRQKEAKLGRTLKVARRPRVRPTE